MVSMRRARVSGLPALISHHSICFARARRERVPCGASCCVPIERSGEVVGFEEVFHRIEDRPPTVLLRDVDGAATGIGQQPDRFQLRHPLPIQAGPRALGFARRHELQAALGIKGVHRRVDPTEGQCLENGLDVRDRWLARGRPPRAQPHAPRRLVIGNEPRPPLSTRAARDRSVGRTSRSRGDPMMKRERWTLGQWPSTKE